MSMGAVSHGWLAAVLCLGCERGPAPAQTEPVPAAAPSGAHVAVEALRPVAGEPAAVVPPSAARGLSATVGGARLRLRGCRLEVEWASGTTQTVDVDLPGPCVFVTTAAGAQVVNTEQGAALLVVSSQPRGGQLPGCDTQIRAVVVRGERAAVSSERQDVTACGAEGPFDSLMFQVLAASSR